MGQATIFLVLPKSRQLQCHWLRQQLRTKSIAPRTECRAQICSLNLQRVTVHSGIPSWPWGPVTSAQWESVWGHCRTQLKWNIPTSFIWMSQPLEKIQISTTTITKKVLYLECLCKYLLQSVVHLNVQYSCQLSHCARLGVAAECKYSSWPPLVTCNCIVPYLQLYPTYKPPDTLLTCRLPHPPCPKWGWCGAGTGGANLTQLPSCCCLGAECPGPPGCAGQLGSQAGRATLRPDTG